MDEATEMEWLQWFFSNADFGPAHGDQMIHLMKWFTKETGKQVPAGYREGYEEDL